LYVVNVYLQGGLRAVIWTDVFQAGVMIIGILIIVIQVIRVEHDTRAMLFSLFALLRNSTSVGMNE